MPGFHELKTGNKTDLGHYDPMYQNITTSAEGVMASQARIGDPRLNRDVKALPYRVVCNPAASPGKA